MLAIAQPCDYDLNTTGKSPTLWRLEAIRSYSVYTVAAPTLLTIQFLNRYIGHSQLLLMTAKV